MMSDLEERERAAFASDPTVKVRDEEERIARKLKEEIARICAMHANKAAFTKSTLKKETPLGGKESMDSGGSALDKEKMLKFGVVEDVLIRSSKKKGSALIVMASKDAAVVATGSVIWGVSNPLLVKPLQQAVTPVFPHGETSVQNDRPKGNLFGAGNQTFERFSFEEAPKGC
ncbi:unnamed protein product [Ilex paraguariensis]|uniref:Uncharacterized protein n=1 Tax=Ilex paraguariensis TaxID=185542 RepID=A0ABC8UY49_9AQUA